MSNNIKPLSYYVVGAVIGICVGFSTGILLPNPQHRPVAAYERKVEGDKRNYLVVEQNNGRKTSFVGVGDGTFKRLEDVTSEEQERLKAQIEKIQEKLQEKN